MPLYIFENEGKIFKTLKKFFKEAEIAAVKRVSVNLRCSNINGAMHKLLVSECLTGAKSVR